MAAKATSKKTTADLTDKTPEERKKALETAISQIEKSFGKGTIIKMGENPKMNVSAVSTGSISLDMALGIGGIPDAAALSLKGKHDLGVHSEMITNSMVTLVENGVITGRKKTLHKGKIVGTFAYGTQKLYDMLDNNPGVLLLRGDYVNDPWVIARNDNFVSVNSCLSVDLSGQVCSESIGHRQYSGSGGQVDMAVGASHAKGGRNIIAVPSTKKGGTVSSITAQLTPGSIVTLSRNEVDCIVTEYGIAWLKGRNVRQRVENLIAVAHPDFRAELRADAEKHILW